MPTATAITGDLSVQLHFEGELQARESTSILSPRIYGRPNIAWLIKEGERVEAGAELVRFDPEELQGKLKEAKSRLEVVEAKLRAHRNQHGVEVDKAEASILLASLDLHLAEIRQTHSEAIPRVDREEATVDLEKASMAIATAESNRTKVDLSATTERELLLLQKRSAEFEIKRFENNLQKCHINTPTPGVVIYKEVWGEKPKVGDWVYPGYPMLELPDLSTMIVVAWVHEVDYPQISVGQHANVVLDAHPGEPIAATITSIAQLATPRGEHNTMNFRVELSLEKTTEHMKPGMTVQVTLLVNELKQVVKIPPSSVTRCDTGPCVWVSGATGYTEAPVEILGRSDEFTAVSGIDAGTIVTLKRPRTR